MFDLSGLDDWVDLLFFSDPLPEIEIALVGQDILPPPHQTFAALKLCQPSYTKVVILGQDPHPSPGYAHGLALSADASVVPYPKSLTNTFSEIGDDLCAKPSSPNLHHWAEQRVFLLNTSLSVLPHQAGVHAKLS